MTTRVLATVAVLSITSLSAQFPLISELEIRPGQQHPSITHMVQDRVGLLWVAGAMGLMRTDGERTEIVHAFSGEGVNALAPYGSGVVMALGSGPVLRCTMAGCDTLWNDAKWADHPVRSLLVTSNERVWIGTRGAGLWWTDGGINRSISSVKGLPDGTINAIAALPSGRVVVATDQGLAVCHTEGVESVFGERDGARDNLVLSVATTHSGLVIAGTDRAGVFRWDPLTGHHAHLSAEEGIHSSVSHVAAEGERVWFATDDDGLIMYDGGRDGGLYRHGAGERITDLMVDRTGAVWWCTATDRVMRADPAVLVVPEHEGLDLRNITALAVDADDHIWFATAQGLFHHTSAFGGERSVIPVQLDLDPMTPIVSLAATADGTVWAATFGSGALAIHRNGRVDRLTTKDGLLNDNVLAVRSYEQEVWFGTLEGITLLSDGRMTSYASSGPGFVYDVLPQGKGMALCATDGSGVVRVGARSAWKALKGGESTYYSLVADAMGKAWAVGPGTGFCSVVGDSLECTDGDRIPFNGNMYQLGSWGNRVIASGSTGVIAFDPTTGYHWDLTSRLGLAGMDAELNAICTDRSGGLWFACHEGLMRLDPAISGMDGSVLTVVTDVLVGAERVAWEQGLTTEHDRNDVTFRFSGLHYAEPGAVHFEYRLLGYDERIQRTRERQVAYALLPPGELVFQVRSFVGDEPHPDPPWTTVQLTVQAPWYRLPWVIALAVVLLISSVVLSVRIRERRIRERQRLEQDRVRFELDALRSKVDPHFLFNSFNTLMDLIESDAPRALEHVEQLSAFFRNTLHVRDKELITLEDELKLMDNYFALEQLRFSEAIALNKDIPGEALGLYMVPMTLQLLVENALKHNQATLSRPLVIDVAVEEEYLVVSNSMVPKLSPPRSTGFGLQSIRKRYGALTSRPMSVEQHDGRFTVRIPLIIAGT